MGGRDGNEHRGGAKLGNNTAGHEGRAATEKEECEGILPAIESGGLAGPRMGV